VTLEHDRTRFLEPASSRRLALSVCLLSVRMNRTGPAQQARSRVGMPP
jgi:hypothetical protein